MWNFKTQISYVFLTRRRPILYFPHGFFSLAPSFAKFSNFFFANQIKIITYEPRGVGVQFRNSKWMENLTCKQKNNEFFTETKNSLEKSKKAKKKKRKRRKPISYNWIHQHMTTVMTSSVYSSHFLKVTWTQSCTTTIEKNQIGSCFLSDLSSNSCFTRGRLTSEKNYLQKVTIHTWVNSGFQYLQSKFPKNFDSQKRRLKTMKL